MRRAVVVLLFVAVLVAASSLYMLRDRGGRGVEARASLHGHKLSVEVRVSKERSVTVRGICMDGSCVQRDLRVTGVAKLDTYLNRVIKAGSTHRVSVILGDGGSINLTVRAEPPPPPGIRVIQAFYMPGIGLKLLVLNNSTHVETIVAATINDKPVKITRGAIIYPTGRPAEVFIEYKGRVNLGGNTCILFLDNGSWIKVSFKA